jgi:hypothetical protein
MKGRKIRNFEDYQTATAAMGPHGVIRVRLPEAQSARKIRAWVRAYAEEKRWGVRTSVKGDVMTLWRIEPRSRTSAYMKLQMFQQALQDIPRGQQKVFAVDPLEYGKLKAAALTVNGVHLQRRVNGLVVATAIIPTLYRPEPNPEPNPEPKK